MDPFSNAMITVERWLTARIPDARFDEDGVVALERDDETLVVIEIASSGLICHLYAPVCGEPDKAPELALLNALMLNRFGRPLGGCWLAWDPDISMFTLCFNLRIPEMDGQTFNNALDNFMASIDHAREQLNPGTRHERALNSLFQPA